MCVSCQRQKKIKGFKQRVFAFFCSSVFLSGLKQMKSSVAPLKTERYAAKTLGPWFLSLHVYIVALFTSIIDYANKPYTFASGTNFAFLLPFLIFVVAKKQLVFLPTTFFLITLLAFSSLMHHLNGCKSLHYRFLDYLSALLLFSFLVLRASWSLFYQKASSRFLLRITLVVTVGLVIGYYKNIASHVDAVMIALGIVTSSLVLFKAYRQWRETRELAIATTTLLICVASLGVAFKQTTDVWTDDPNVYDAKHGMWHILISQFLFVIIYIMVTIGKVQDELISFGWTCAVLFVLLLLHVTNSVTNSALFTVSLVTTLFLLVNWTRLFRVQRKRTADGKIKWVVYPPKPLVLQFSCDEAMF